MNKKENLKNIVLPIAVSMLLVGLFLSFIRNIEQRQAAVIDDINNDRAIALSPDCNKRQLSEIIFNDGYAETKKDADFIASVLVERQNKDGRLPSLYSLQKRAFGQVPVLLADSCGVLLTKQQVSRDKLGQNDEVFPFCKDSIRSGNGRITVAVFEKEESSKWLKKWLNIEDNLPCEGIPVRLTTHFRDSLNQACSAIVGFVQTDANGMAVFEGLDTEASYSVLPIKQGFEFGSSKGTVGGKWKKSKDLGMRFSFEKKEHRIPLFGNASLRQIKTDRSIMVRSPQEYKAIVVQWFIYVLLAWWALYLYMVIRKKKFNGALLSSCMFLTGMCVLMMFSMQDPLNDELHGVTMAKGVIAGLIICLFLQSVDFVKFYQNKGKVGFDIPLNVFRWLFKPYRQKVVGLASTLKSNAGILKKMFAMVLVLITLPFLILDLLHITRLSKPFERVCEKMPKGIGWLVIALVLTALLWTHVGQSIGGMRVNLNLFGVKFQPSEIAKYLILFFVAAFFTQQADTIIAYSQPNRINMIGKKVKTLSWIILGLAVLMAMYLVLGDMGPGLVLGTTFVLLYSLIKSKVNLDNLGEEDRWMRIFSCDFAMLIYGVLTFAVFLLVGYRLGGKAIALLFGVLWFVFWIAFGYLGFKKQLFESAVLINVIIFAFIFGGDIMQRIPALKDSSAVERFNDRIEMCTNTWGDLDIEHHGENAKDVSNSQVANGLWALASGGMSGQGWGGGKPSLVPAFHTDMILSSIGEQRGWFGLLMVVIALAVLLRKMAVIGYRAGHPFAFYLCLGFAIVIGVQFFIIALGGSGIIPLTGVTVPFLSFGRVSMILNLAAFGVVLSLCNNISEEKTAVSASVRKKTVKQYSYPIAMVTMVFMFFAVSTLLVWQYYQFWKRDNTLIHPAYVINNQGAPVVEYNPRINLLVRNMYAGRIYDRNGLLLVTSDKTEITPEQYKSIGIDEQQLSNMLKRNQKRYYPMGEHTFFMVGDQNEGLMFAYDENHPVGYMAEVQHLSYLRNFDNVMYDKSGKPIRVQLKTNRLKESAYLALKDTVSDPILLRDYKELLPFLKDGIDGKKVKDHNQAVKDSVFDLHLTIDASLQADMQNSIANYMQEKHKGNGHFNLMRVSAVVLDAENGDLLASANYPLPDYNRLIDEDEMARAMGKRFAVYSDNKKRKDWTAYTDRDLGTTYQTYPGSTAKVMSAMAGLRQYGTDISNQTYYITNDDAIELNDKGISKEPCKGKYYERHRRFGRKTIVDRVDMWLAIVESSNCYFMNLVNDLDLYASLDSIYKTTGVGIGSKVPYYFTMKKDNTWRDCFDAKVTENRGTALAKYESYRNNVKKGIHNKMDAGEWKWAWGQGYEHFELQASPLNMARVASTVVNNGKMPITQYLKGNNNYEKDLRNEAIVQLMKPDEASILRGYMLAEAANQAERQRDRVTKQITVTLPSYVGGKTGTPERERVISERKKNDKLNDGWYMFFVEGDATHHPIAVAVRMERGLGSGPAVCLTGNLLLDCLNRHGYIRNN